MDADLELVVARLLDFFGRRTPWHRRLWGPSLIHCIDEVAELSAIVRETGKGAESLLSYRRFLKTEIEADAGVSELQRDQLVRLLNSKPNLTPADVRQLQHLREQIAVDYVAGWQSSLYATETAGVPVERLARSIAATMMDRGFSPSGLHQWVTALTSGRRLDSLSALFDEVTARLTLPVRTWSVVVPVQQVPFRRHPKPAHYLSARQVLERLPAPLDPGVRIRVNGAFEFTVEALDAPAAATAVGARVRRLAARITVGLPTADELIVAPVAWVERDGARGTWQPLREPQRSLEIGTLYRNKLVFTETDATSFNLDAAFELLSSVEVGTPGAAVATAWASIESLLCETSDAGGQVAAARMAAIVTCSLPRAELTPLGHVYKDSYDDALAEELRTSRTNLRRSLRMEEAIRQGIPTFQSASDRAAVARLRSFVEQPDTLERVHKYLEQSFLRLLRLRNRVMHGGTADSSILSAVIGTAPALVGAGIDRIAHGVLSSSPQVAPLDLAARAQTNLDQAQRGGPTPLASLLEAPNQP